MLALYLVKLLLAYSVVRFLAEPLIAAASARGALTKLGLSAALKTACCALLLVTEVRPAMVVTILLFATASSIIDWEPVPSSIPPRLPYGTDFLFRLVGQFALCATVAVWWSTSGSMAHMRDVALSILSSPRPLMLGTGYVIGVFGGSELTRRVVEHFGMHLSQGQPSVGRPGLKEAGRYIGWLERGLIITFVIGNFGEAVGFLLAAKAIVRYPEMDEDGAFAEYFLVGTLTSVGVALVVGTVLRQSEARP
jgi:hypothetical protein